MSKSNKKIFSFENDLNFETLSNLLNELGVVTHPLTNEQKVCIEYPNIFSESKNIDIIGDNSKKVETEGDKENKSQNNEMTLNISKNKNYTINIEKLHQKLKNKSSYTQEMLTNSLKIFVSIFNNFNEDIFKWNLEDSELFNSSNKIQLFLIKDIIQDELKLNEKLDNLYKEHLEKGIKNSIIKSKNVDIAPTDDFVDDFEDNKVQQTRNNNTDDSFDDNNLMIIGDNQNEDENIFKNIYFLINIFNLMNSFYLNDFNIDNLMRNISLFNSYIINDSKILLLIHFNLCIQINLTLSKQTVDNFLGISSTNKTATTISSTMGPLNKTINFFSGGNEKSNNNSKNGNTYIPSIFFLDYYFLDPSPIDKNNEENRKEIIIIFNFILKNFIWTYFIRNKVYLKIYIKLFTISYFSEIMKNIIVNQNLRNNEIINELIKNTNYVNLLNDNLLKEYIFLLNADFKIINELKLDKIEEFFKIYFPIFLNCNMISFEINNNTDKFLLNDFIEELNIIIWLFKFYLKIRKYKFKKYTFTFLSNSFSLAIKKNKINMIEESYTKEITLFMGINHYKPIELINHLRDINNFNSIYKLYKSIIKSCNDYKNYDIGIRLFKDDINNKELRYYIAMLILKLENYIDSHKDLYKKLILYENKIINPLNCVYLNIKKKLLKIKNKQNNNNTKNENELNVNFKIKEKNEGGVLSKIDIFSMLKKTTKDSNADRNDININNFYKSLGGLGLNHEEKMAIYNFIKEVKYYFTEFIVFSSKNIIFNTKNTSFEPLNVLQHFTNNKCFIIINDMTFIDLYIYLTDSFDINFLTKEDNTNSNTNEKEIKSPSIFFNAIVSNIKVLKFVCKENFNDNHGHIQLRNVNFILSKSTLFQNELFQDYKSLFNENNNIYVLDEYTKTNCIFGETHISLISNLDEEELESENNQNYLYDNYFSAFYSMFLNAYDIIKFINNKKLRKYNKLDIIYNNKILQIKEGKIQIKKICKEEEINISNNNENENKEENKEDNNLNNKKEDDNINNIINNENINNNNNDIKNEDLEEKREDNKINIINDNKEDSNKKKELKYIKHNFFKTKELFQYKNSYPLLSFMLLKETEISNLSFLFYIFEEIFLSKKSQQETMETIIRKIIKFFVKFKSSEFIPIIFSEKYFEKFILFFNKIINKKESNLSTHRENEKNQLFENVVLFPLDNSNINITDKIQKIFSEDKNILKNLISNFYLFKVNINKYSKNQMGKLFKFNRIINTMDEFGSKSKIIKNNDHFYIYEISNELLDDIIKINKKKIQLFEKENNDDKNKEEIKKDDSIKECLIF